MSMDDLHLNSPDVPETEPQPDAETTAPVTGGQPEDGSAAAEVSAQASEQPDAAQADGQPAAEPAAEAGPQGGEQPVSAGSAPAEPDRRHNPPDRAAIDAEYVAKAAERDEYLVYEHDTFRLPGGAPLNMYAASRIGLGHIGKKKPCQDSCLYRRISHGAVLLDADGVSACSHSDYGSRNACEIAADHVEKLSLQQPDENAFIRELCSDRFYAGIREEWVARMKEHWKTIPERNEQENPLVHYGSTLLIAVVTENWYVTMNLGDGQMLLFNDAECMRIQLVDKETQAPSCLIYDTYLEDVRRGVWPRRLYKGVLIMTDGMNDRLSKLPWTACHDYALQAAERFSEHEAPYQPFIYSGVVAGEQRTFDVSRQRSASDDFSVVMALNSDHQPDESQAIATQLRNAFPDAVAIQMLRRVGRRASYMVGSADGYQVVFVTPETKPLMMRAARLEQFMDSAVKPWEPERRWSSGGLRYSAYRLPSGAPCQFLEEAMQGFSFKTPIQYHKVADEYDPRTGLPRRIVDPLVGEPIALTCRTLRSLEAYLASQGLKLDEMAAYWILQVQDIRSTLLVPREVLQAADAASSTQPWVLPVSQLSPAMIGYLSFDGQMMPVFSPGADPVGDRCYLPTADADDSEAHSRFFCVMHNADNNTYGLRNISQYTWRMTLPDGRQADVAPGKVASFQEGRILSIPTGGARPFECVIHTL